MKIASLSFIQAQRRPLAPSALKAPVPNGTEHCQTPMDSVHFGYGNDKPHLSVVKGSFAKEYGRLKRAGRIPEGQSRDQFVAAKVAVWKQRDRRK